MSVLRRRVIQCRAGNLLTLLLLASAGCSDDVVDPPTGCIITGLTVSIGSSNIEVGSTTNVTAAYTVVRGCNPAPTVSWQSTAPNVASVNSSGQVTGLAQGTSSIIATVAGQTNQVVIEVRPVAVASIEITPAQPTVEVSGTVQLTAVLRAANGTVLTGRLVTWQSLTPSIATVNPAGQVVGVAGGTATIEATAENVKQQVTVTVQFPPASVTVTLANSAISIGRTTQASAVVRDAQGNVQTNRTVTWASSATNVATVNASGLVTAVGIGTATIRAEVNGFPSVSNVATVNVVVAFALANIDLPLVSVTNASGFNSSGGPIGFTRLGLGFYRLTFSGIGLGTGGIGSRFAIYVNAKSAVDNTMLTVPTAVCTAVSAGNSQPLDVEVRCEDAVTSTAEDSRFRVVVIGENSLVAGGLTPYAYTTHNNLSATAPYTPPPEFSFNSQGTGMQIVPNAGAGTFSGLEIGHNQGIATPQTAALITSTISATPGVVCNTQSESNPPLVTAVCFTRSGPVNASHTLITAASGRAGLPAAHAFVRGDGVYQSVFSFSTGTSITATRTATGKYRVTFNGVDGSTRPMGFLVGPYGAGEWRHCNHFVISANPVTVDVACFNSTGTFIDSSFGLYILQ